MRLNGRIIRCNGKNVGDHEYRAEGRLVLADD